MKYQDKERILYEILSGIKILKTKAGIVHVHSPSIFHNNEASFIYQQVYKDAITNGSYTIKNLTDKLVGMGLFSSKDLDFIEQSGSKIESLQRQLYYNRDNPIKFDSIKENLRVIRLNVENLNRKYRKYDGYTAEGIANYMKSLYLLRKTARQNKKKIPYTSNVYNDILNCMYESHIPQSTIRLLARSTPWVNMWIGLKNNGLIFKTGVSISLEQQLLLMWTKIYDNVQESPEPPTDNVINDDDLFDGWMMCQKNKDNKDSFNNHEEVFIVAETDEDLAKIENMNSFESKNIKKNRIT